MSADDVTVDTSKVPVVHTLAPISVTICGIALLAYMVYAEGEPGVIPLLLIGVGLGWYIAARIRSRRK